MLLSIFLLDIIGGKYQLTRWYSQRTSLRRWRKIARRFRGLAIDMGGMLIKLGQFLSTRADIFPSDVTDELAGLQDEVPAAETAYILQIIAEELGGTAEEYFASFAQQPIAAASFGQVHFGTLHDGRPVAIKVQRPAIEQLVEIDAAAISWSIRWIKNYPLIRQRADLDALFAEFIRVLRLELDYLREAQNALTFRQNFANDPNVYFPEPYLEHTTARVLVMEQIHGIKITDYAALTAAQVNRNDVAERLTLAYLKQFFLDGFFHADPHPGNLFVRVDAPPTSANAFATYTLIFVDCGMVGVLSKQTMAMLSEGMFGLATNDAERVVDALDQLKMIRPNADHRQIVAAFQAVLRHTYNRSMREMTNMDMQVIFDETEDLIHDLPFQIPQDLIYLGRAVGMLSGMATALNPDINLFETARPFALKLIAQQQTVDSLQDRVLKELQTLGQIALTLPRQVDSLVKTINRGDLQVRMDLSRLERGMRRVERSTNRLSVSIAAGAVLLGSVLLRINGFGNEAFFGYGVAALIALWAFWPRGER